MLTDPLMGIGGGLLGSAMAQQQQQMALAYQQAMLRGQSALLFDGATARPVDLYKETAEDAALRLAGRRRRRLATILERKLDRMRILATLWGVRWLLAMATLLGVVGLTYGIKGVLVAVLG